jgi:hypothetical protein
MTDRFPARLTAAMCAGAALLLAVAGCGSSQPTGRGAASSRGATSATGLTGCKLITQQEAEQQLGAKVGAGTETAKTVTPPIQKVTGCTYFGSGGSLGYDVATYSIPLPGSVMAAQAAAHHVKVIQVDGATTYVATAGKTTVAVGVMGGQTYSVLVTSGRPGVALAVLTLLIQRT